MAKVDLPDLPSNSNKSRERNEKIRDKDLSPIVENPVQVKPRSFGRKMVDMFIADRVENVKDYVIEDVLVPSIIDTVLDMVNTGLSMLFGTNNRSTSSRSRSGSSGYRPGYTSYTSYHDEPKRSNNRANLRERESYSLGDLIVNNRGEAERILDRLIDILNEYEVVSVGDLYQIAGISTKPSDFNYGWYNLDNATTKKVKGGYLIDLPRSRTINQ